MPCSPPLPQALIVVYAFHFPHLLNPQIEHCAHRALYRQHILGIILRGPALCFAAAGFSLFFYPAVSGGAEEGRVTVLGADAPGGWEGGGTLRSQPALCGGGAGLCQGCPRATRQPVVWRPRCPGAQLEGRGPGTCPQGEESLPSEPGPVRKCTVQGGTGH